MKDEDSAWNGLSSSSSDDEDCLGSGKTKAAQTRSKSSVPQRQRMAKKTNPTRSFRLSSSSSSEYESFLSLPRKPSLKKATAKGKPLSKSNKKVSRKRPLPRSSTFSGNLSDTSSDDSLLFKSTIASTDKKKEIHASDSDSDDTAELLRQLARNSTQPNKVVATPSQQNNRSAMPQYAKPKDSPSSNRCVSKSIGDRDDHDADDENSFAQDLDDDQSIAREEKETPKSNSKIPPVDPPREVFANMVSTSNLSESLQNPLQGTTSNPGFELPTQSSSSEESSDSSTEDDESSKDEDQAKPNIPNGTTSTGILYSTDQTMISNFGDRRHPDERFLSQSNQQLFDTAFGNGSNSRHGPQEHQQPCIDLVDSDDNEPEMTGLVYENRNSSRSPTTRKSPKFNVAARNFLYNKPWTNTNHRQDEQEDVIQFEDDDRKVPARPRRVTQDHLNPIPNLHHYSGDRNNYGRAPAVADHLPPNHSSNFLNQQTLPPQPQSNHHSNATNTISRSAARSRRMRDPTSTNVSLAASVVTRNRTCSGNGGNIGDIRTFVTRRPALAFETRNRAKSIESVRASRHDIQGHTNVTVVNPPAKTRGSTSQRGEQPEDVIEVFDEEPVKRPARSRKTTAKAKPKRKRTYTRKTKTRGGRKRTRKGTRKGASRRYGSKRSAKSNDDAGAWGSTGGGWSSERPVHREDPAFRNVGAEITF